MLQDRAKYRRASYHVDINTDSARTNTVNPLVLRHDEKWERMMSSTPDRLGGNQKAELLLYKGAEAELCLKPLRLWIDVMA